MFSTIHKRELPQQQNAVTEKIHLNLTNLFFPTVPVFCFFLGRSQYSYFKIYSDHHPNALAALAAPGAVQTAAACIKERPHPSTPDPVLTHPISANSTERKREATGQMMYLSSGVDMASLPACVCVLEGKGVGGCRVTVRELEKGGMKERGIEGRGEQEGGMAGGVLNLPPSLSPCCPPTPPPSRLSEAGDRRRVGFCVCVFEEGGQWGCLHCLACGCQRSGTWSRPPRALQ